MCISYKGDVMTKAVGDIKLFVLQLCTTQNDLSFRQNKCQGKNMDTRIAYACFFGTDSTLHVW